MIKTFVKTVLIKRSAQKQGPCESSHRHVWESYMEELEEIRHTLGMKERYQKRKETIERVFADAKEKHAALQ